jgi:hypothetical protein
LKLKSAVAPGVAAMPRSSGSKKSATAAQSTATRAVIPMLQQVARTQGKRAVTQFALKNEQVLFVEPSSIPTELSFVILCDDASTSEINGLVSPFTSSNALICL